MIFVVAGTQKFQLNRLLKEVDELCATGKIQEDVIAQTGHSDYRPRHYQAVDFLLKPQFEEYIERCDLLITHGGIGTIISGLDKKKPVIVFPRLKKYNEHVDNHQLEIAQAFSRFNYILLCNENDDLYSLIKESHHHIFSEYILRKRTVIDTINHYLEGI